MSSAFDSIIAQPVAVRVLTRAVQSGRIANSYLFEGPSGVGKSMAALALAQAVLCPKAKGRGCGECDVCRRAREGSHPDVRTFGPRDEGNRNIQVEFLRNEILPVAQFAPFEAEAAFLIFPEADVSFPEVHPESANALLKTLEEPRPGVHFLLLSERPDRLLPTIRSRCQNVRFSRLPATVLERILSEHGVPEADRGPAAALADGRADRALAMAESGTSQEVLERALAIDASVASRKPGSLVSIAEELARSDDSRADAGDPVDFLPGRGGRGPPRSRPGARLPASGRRDPRAGAGGQPGPGGRAGGAHPRRDGHFRAKRQSPECFGRAPLRPRAGVKKSYSGEEPQRVAGLWTLREGPR